MSEAKKIIIPTKPYLKKYLHSLYGSGREIRFNTHNTFGIKLIDVLKKSGTKESKNQNLVPTGILNRTVKNDLNQFDTLLELHFSKNITSLSLPGQLEIHQAVDLNKFFEKEFTADVWRLCTIICVFGSEIKQALQEVAESYNIIIGEDITMQALQQKEFRYRKTVEMNDPELSTQAVRKGISTFFVKAQTADLSRT